MKQVSEEKESVGNLAAFGGVPLFAEPLHVGRPNVGNREKLMQRINGVFDSHWFTNNGRLVREFEIAVAGLLGVKHCVAVVNGTVALDILIRAAELKGEVILPSFTFIATAHAVQWAGLRPVFCEIDEDSHNIDPAAVERLVTPETTAIIGVHLWGRPCNTQALARIAKRHHVKLLYDAAHAFACSNQGEMVGNFGDGEVLSFHATKFINSFEGGAIVTNDDALAARSRLMRNFGFVGYDEVVDIGTNGKLTEISAAMGLTSLESLDDFIRVNRENYHLYQSELIKLSGVKLLTLSDNHNYQYVVVEIDEGVHQISRDVLLKVLWAENIIARRYFWPGCHRMEPYRSSQPWANISLPVTERIARQVLVLPTGTAIDAPKIKAICGVIRAVLANADEVNQRLKPNQFSTN